jgi:type II secretory pathway component GspD/PulD (secretin)
MLSNSFRLSLTLLATLLLATTALAQGNAQSTQPAPEAEDRFVTQKGFNNRIFEVRHRDPSNLAVVLRTLGSGFRGAAVTSNNEFRTISVRDFPENITAMEEALRRLDQPEPPRPGVEFQVHLLAASNDAATTDTLPAGLGEVVTRLRSALGYRTYSLMGSQVIRSKDGRMDVSNKGVAAMVLASETVAAKSPAYYNYGIRQVNLDGAAGAANVRIEEFIFNLRIPIALPSGSVTYEEVGFRNPVTLREGERVVAGTTSIADKSVVVVITATTAR